MMSKEVVLPAGEVKKARRRRRRAGARAAKKRARKTASVTTGVSLSPPEVTSPVKCAVHTFLLRYQSALRRIPSQLPPRVHAGPPSKRVKRVSWCHEDGGVSSGGGGDPAVLAVGPSRRALTYTRDELMRLRHSPLVKKGLEDAFAGCEALALVLKKRSDSPNEEDRGGRGDAPSENHKPGVYGRERRSADPRERVRKESEGSAGGIVLSPQRRSFTSGCGAPAAAAAPPPHVARTRPDSPLSNAKPDREGASVSRGERDAGGRRIGSGRIMVRDELNEGREGRSGGGTGRSGGEKQPGWEREDDYRPEPYRPPPQQRLNGDRYERRSFGRDSYSSDIKREREDRFNNDKMRDRDDNRRSGGRYGQRRYDKDDEPEWFSGGPTSQHDTIELCGFEEHEKKKSMMKNGNANNKETDKWSNSNRSRSPAPERWRETSSPVAPPDDSANSSNDKDSGVDSKTEELQQNNENEFNLDDFLKLDAIPDVLTNGGGETEGSSRFSQWFRRESPTNDLHYERILHNMVDELDNSTHMEPTPIVNSEPQHVFAPISPVRPQPPSLMDLLLRANEPRPQEAAGSAGKVHSLEELEARLRPQQPPHHAVPDHDLTAFKRLLAQVSGGHAVTAEHARPQPPPPPPQPQPQPQPQPHQPMSLLQMLNKSMEQQQQQKVQLQQQQQQQQQPPVIPPDLVYKLLHVQQRQQQTEQLNAHMGPDRELLQRPEAQAILHGLKSGEITAQHLMQQLGNPGLQSRHREMLLTILRMQQQHHQRQMQSGGSPLPMGGAPPHLVVPPHHQPLRLSPLPHQAFCVSPIMATSPNLSVHHPGAPPRIPSPRELAVHTQSIMQSALIKKKLEEQRENYNRRRAEIMHQPKQSTPISFTPTSVLRKMTAEKESDAQSPKQPWNHIKMPQMGRPIVKGNHSGAPTMGYAPSQSEYQQHYMNQQQQQMLNNIRPFPHPPLRQQPAPSNRTMTNPPPRHTFNNMGRGMPGNTTLHQLLAQSHQRSLNDLISEMGNVGAGGGDNQLARWFSPELLARASAGKLPSVHVPNALSLEDLERHHHSPAPVVRN